MVYLAKSNKKNVPLKDVNTREEIRKKKDEDFVKLRNLVIREIVV